MTTSESRTNAVPGLGRRLSNPCAAPAARPASLAQTVQAAARALDGNALRPLPRDCAPLACSTTTLLTVLAYCYAMQIYGSAEIEALLRQDANLRPLCQNQFPNASVIRRFRRENRESLQICLEAALRFVAEQKVAQGIIARVNSARLAEEARRRIITAMFTDSMVLDKDQGTDTPTDLCYLIANRQSPAH